MILSDSQLDQALRRLNLANTRQHWTSMCAKAEVDNWSYRDFLATAVSEEIAHRQGTRLRRLARKAGFPYLKTIDDFDFSHQSALRLTMLGTYLSPEFVSEGRNLILLGRPGRGKTHLAVAIAYRAIQNGFEACFVTAAALIDDLSMTTRQDSFRDRLAAYLHPHVLVIDELGYLSYGADAANVLFHVVNERHQRKRPIIITTNKHLSDWGTVLHDQDLAEAIVDRILENGRPIQLDGPSIRTKHLGVDPIGQTVIVEDRISGIHRPDFPEPADVLQILAETGCERSREGDIYLLIEDPSATRFLEHPGDAEIAIEAMPVPELLERVGAHPVCLDQVSAEVGNHDGIRLDSPGLCCPSSLRHPRCNRIYVKGGAVAVNKPPAESDQQAGVLTPALEGTDPVHVVDDVGIDEFLESIFVQVEGAIRRFHAISSPSFKATSRSG